MPWPTRWSTRPARRRRRARPRAGGAGNVEPGPGARHRGARRAGQGLPGRCGDPARAEKSNPADASAETAADPVASPPAATPMLPPAPSPPANPAEAPALKPAETPIPAPARSLAPSCTCAPAASASGLSQAGHRRAPRRRIGVQPGEQLLHALAVLRRPRPGAGCGVGGGARAGARPARPPGASAAGCRSRLPGPVSFASNFASCSVMVRLTLARSGSPSEEK